MKRSLWLGVVGLFLLSSCPASHRPGGSADDRWHELPEGACRKNADCVAPRECHFGHLPQIHGGSPMAAEDYKKRMAELVAQVETMPHCKTDLDCGDQWCLPAVEDHWICVSQPGTCKVSEPLP